jgi:hypothetical protein
VERFAHGGYMIVFTLTANHESHAVLSTVQSIKIRNRETGEYRIGVVQFPEDKCINKPYALTSHIIFVKTNFPGFQVVIQNLTHHYVFIHREGYVLFRETVRLT